VKQEELIAIELSGGFALPLVGYPL